MAPAGSAHETVRGPAEGFPVVLRRSLPHQQEDAAVSDRGEPEHRQIIIALERLQRETRTEKIAVVLDNARFHHAKALTGLYEPGQLLERITPIFLPPYAPDHNPVEHVWNTAKTNIANIQRETPDQTFGAFASYITGRTFDYDFEHLPKPQPETDLVS
ncbi:transposase [Propionibacterium australiense]|uniref:transposase n=1 Tax=Propionibacterium australiense TaxID=119981 RepID=UPI0035BE7F88